MHFVPALHASPVDQVEQEDRKQDEEEYHQEWAKFPKIRNHHISNFSYFFDGGEYFAVGQAKNYRAS